MQCRFQAYRVGVYHSAQEHNSLRGRPPGGRCNASIHESRLFLIHSLQRIRQTLSTLPLRWRLMSVTLIFRPGVRLIDRTSSDRLPLRFPLGGSIPLSEVHDCFGPASRSRLVVWRSSCCWIAEIRCAVTYSSISSGVRAEIACQRRDSVRWTRLS